jgi:DNA primase
MKRISPDFLRQIRNQVEITRVIDDLRIPSSPRRGQRTFRCPECESLHASTIPDHNLAHCFQCERTFNPIDLVMAERDVSFLEAVDALARLLVR